MGDLVIGVGGTGEGLTGAGVTGAGVTLDFFEDLVDFPAATGAAVMGAAVGAGVTGAAVTGLGVVLVLFVDFLASLPAWAEAASVAK